MDSRESIVDFFLMASDETTITRKESVRLREAIIQGVLDADTQTDVVLSGLPNNIEIFAVIGMVRETGTASWDVYDSRAANDAADSFRVLVNVTNPTRQIRFAEVGASQQGGAYRIWVKYVERI